MPSPPIFTATVYPILDRPLLAFLIGLLLCSTSASSQVLVPLDTTVTMRDGAELAVDIHLPDGPGPWPTILIQTPYWRVSQRLSGLPLGVDFDIASSPYAFVVADWRCFYGSLAACVALPERGKDGYDLVEWVAAQTWSDGQVGTWGPSALGQIQFMTAREQPPHLVAAMPMVCDPVTAYRKYYTGGVLRDEYVESLDILGFGLGATIRAHPEQDLYWDVVEGLSTYLDQIAVPCLVVGGWFDHNTAASLDAYAGLRQESPAAVRDQHHLLMGPWAHGGANGNGVGSTTAGDFIFPEGENEDDRLGRAFFDFHLLGLNNGWELEKPVRYAQSQEAAWRETDQWPPSDTATLLFWLDAGSDRRSGDLVLALPSENKSTLFSNDPTDPSPTIGGRTLRFDLQQGPRDQAPIVESRDDIALFSTAPFRDKLVLQGPLSLRVYASIDRLDADIMVRLTDVYPDGRSIGLSESAFRLRHREGFRPGDAVPALAGTVYAVDISLPDMAYTFLEGHRLRLLISGSNWPQYDRNLQNGGAVLAPGDSLTAHITLHTGPLHPAAFRVTSSVSGTGLIAHHAGVLPSPALRPNPAAGTFEALADMATSPREWDLLNSQGQSVLQGVWPAGASRIRIDGSSIPPGLYRLRVSGLRPKPVILTGN